MLKDGGTGQVWRWSPTNITHLSSLVQNALEISENCTMDENWEKLGHNCLREAFREIALWMKIQGSWPHLYEEGIQGNCSMDENPRNLVTFPCKKRPRKLHNGWKFEEIGSTSPREYARKLHLINEKSKEVSPIFLEKWGNRWVWRCFKFFGTVS